VFLTPAVPVVLVTVTVAPVRVPKAGLNFGNVTETGPWLVDSVLLPKIETVPVVTAAL